MKNENEHYETVNRNSKSLIDRSDQESYARVWLT